jgi:hypothetical protein|tara:strand:- start:600 stop:797 length:198 start_codon:yes stop_codon:yes gene_type:complete
MSRIKSWLMDLQEMNATGPCADCNGMGELERISWKRFDTALEPVVEGYEDCVTCNATGEVIKEDE